MTRPEFAELRQAWPEITPTVLARPDKFVEILAAPCPYLEGTRCSVYAVRPLNCRRYMCGRFAADEPREQAPIPLVVLKDRNLRRQYALTQRRAMARWGHAHGWQDA